MLPHIFLANTFLFVVALGMCHIAGDSMALRLGRMPGGFLGAHRFKKDVKRKFEHKIEAQTPVNTRKRIINFTCHRILSFNSSKTSLSVQKRLILITIIINYSTAILSSSFPIHSDITLFQKDSILRQRSKNYDETEYKKCG